MQNGCSSSGQTHRKSMYCSLAYRLKLMKIYRFSQDCSARTIIITRGSPPRVEALTPVSNRISHALSAGVVSAWLSFYYTAMPPRSCLYCHILFIFMLMQRRRRCSYSRETILPPFLLYLLGDSPSSSLCHL